jgi:hypothetical protein
MRRSRGALRLVEYTVFMYSTTFITSHPDGEGSEKHGDGDGAGEYV